jgi:hypothetical protein
MLEQKLQEELNRFNAINKYGKKMIMEQEVPPVPEAPVSDESPLDAPATDVETPEAPAVPDAPLDTDAPMTDSPETDSTEEIDITDLVNMTKSIKKDIDDNKQEHGNVMGQMDSVFTKLDDLESKLSQMDSLISKIDELGSKIQDIKPKTPQEKLEMRSLDSYPFNEKPQEFFAHKQDEMQQSGKNEYVLTKDEVENYPQETIRTTFNPEIKQDEFKF